MNIKNSLPHEQFMINMPGIKINRMGTVQA